MNWLPRTLRQWVIAGFAAGGLGLLPWSIWLAASLSPRHATERWDLAWSGFDSGLAVMFVLTAIAAWRRTPWVGIAAAATGTLLVTDAWFDVVLESHADEMRMSILFAAIAELPVAALCFWIAYRTEQFLARVVGEVEALHLATADKRPSESDLVGVLKVAADRQPTREPSHADSPA